MQQVQNFLQGAAKGVLDYYPNRFSLIGAAFCASAAAEIAIRAVGILYKRSHEGQKDQLDVCATLAKASFYGLCATNIVPGTAAIGAIIAIAENLVFSGRGNNYYSSPLFVFTSRLLGFCNDCTGLIDPDTKRSWVNAVKNRTPPSSSYIGIGLLGLGYAASHLSYKTMLIGMRIAIVAGVVLYEITKEPS